MDCQGIRESYVATLTTGGDFPADLARHVRECDGCRDELAGLAATWATLGRLPLVEPSPALASRLRRRLRWAVVWETAGSWPGWQGAALAGVFGVVISVLLSVVLPYDAMAALCRDLAPRFLPGPAAYWVAGLIYGLLPMSLAGALAGRGRGLLRSLGAVEAALVFLIVVLPYVVARCSEFPVALLTGFLGGIAAGGVAGAAAGARLTERRAWG